MKKQATIHGENILVPVESVPAGKAKQLKTYIVGHSETGHNHVLETTKDETFDVIMLGNDVFITTKTPTSLVHKKAHDIHQTLTIAPGTYKVAHAIEYNPFTKRLQEVYD